jgi:hypothetical protein
VSGGWLAAAIAVVAAVCLGDAASASAQTASEIALARRQFRQGLAAARRDDWERARDAFQRSYDLSQRPITLLNLAGALLQTGRLVEGSEAYRQFLRGDDRVTDRHRDEAEEALATVETRVPHARIRVLGFAADDTLTLDEFDLDPAAIGEELPVDPGDHVIAVTRAGHEPVRTSWHIEEGETRDVIVDVRSLAPAVDLNAANDPVDEPTILESPWLWVAAGVLVAGGITAGILIAGGEGDPAVGNLPPFRVGVE